MHDISNPIELTAEEIAAVAGGEGIIGSGMGRDGGTIGSGIGKDGGGTIGSGT